MNNATLVLNAARPPAPPSGHAAQTSSNDGDASSSRFDAAMDAARSDTPPPATAPAPAQPQSDDTPKPEDAAKAAGDGKASAKKPGVDTAKKDDKSDKDDGAHDADTSIASAMLALIGVTPKAAAPGTTTTQAAGDAAGKAIASLGNGALAAFGADATATGTGAQNGLLAALGAGTSAAATAVTDAVTSPAALFGALLGAQTGEAGAIGKDDDALSATDPTQAMPMPALHPGTVPVDGSPVQVQATQAATSPQFAQELGEQIAWMGSGQVKEARIKLHPEELGSMDVRVNMDGGKVNVAIMAQHPAAVHAVQQTLSQLDTLLAHHGLSLGQADVGQGQNGQGGEGDASAQAQAGQGEDAAANTVVSTSSVSRGLVDEVA